MRPQRQLRNQLLDSSLQLYRLDPPDHALNRERFPNCEILVKAQELRTIAHVSPGLIILLNDGLGTNERVAAVRGDLPGQDTENRRLAGPVGPQQTEALALTHPKGDALERVDRGLAEPLIVFLVDLTQDDLPLLRRSYIRKQRYIFEKKFSKS